MLTPNTLHGLFSFSMDCHQTLDRLFKLWADSKSLFGVSWLWLWSVLLLGTFSALLIIYYVYLVTYIQTIKGFETARKEIATLKWVGAVAYG